MMAKKKQPHSAKSARYEKEFLPQSYESWRYCIEHKCGLRLTTDYVEQRLRILNDPRQEETRRFARIYGDAHLAQVVAWFEQAAAEL